MTVLRTVTEVSPVSDAGSTARGREGRSPNGAPHPFIAYISDYTRGVKSRSHLLRGALVGVGLSLAFGYRETRGFNRDYIARDWDHFFTTRFGEPSRVPVPVETAALYAAYGAGWGAGCALSVRALRLPRVVGGAAYGLIFWALFEAIYRALPSRTRVWASRDPVRAATGAAGKGVLAALLVGRSRSH